MTSKIIEIGKRRWLVGMTWRSFEEAPDSQQLDSDAESLNASWVSVRNGRAAVQAGFCAALPGIKKPSKVYSLAAMLADSREQPWLGIFRIADDLWWYVAVRDGHAIMPSDGDVVGGEDEIKRVRDGHSGFADWNHVEGDLTTLAKLIDSIDESPTPVRSLNSSFMPSMPWVVGATVLLLAACGGGFWWQQKLLQEQRETEAAMARVRAQLEAGKPIVSTALPSPLLTMPAANDWLAACGTIMLVQHLSRSGWALSAMTCNSSSVVIQWRRDAGATVALRPDGVVSADGEGVTETVSLTGLEASGADDSVELNDASLALRAWAQSAMFTLSIAGAESKASPVALPGKPADVIATPVTRPELSFTLDMLVSPFNMDLSAVPGLRLRSLKTTENGWHIEGTLYGR
ncbi:MAG: type 4b pilus protein PilO2 [Pseudomonadota bacterium]